MIIDCPICGKLTCIHWPQFWPYVRGTAYYCSWTCMDVSLCRDMNLIKAADMKKRSKKNMKTIVTKEQKQKAVSMAIDGRDPLEYLREIGSKSPDKMWYQIKASVKESDPELYAKIPDLRKIEKVDQKPEEVPEKPAELPEVKVEVVETPENVAKVIEAPQLKLKPGLRGLNNSDFTVSAIRHPQLGEFYYDRKINSIDWRTPEGEEISLHPSMWEELYMIIPDVMGILQVVDGDE